MKKITISILLCVLVFNACSDKIDYLKEFTGGDERRYAGKVSDLEYFAGENRLALKYALGNDADVNKTVIYWNLRKDSAVILLDRAAMKDDTVFYVLENMPENVYSFELYNYDNSGNKSIPVYLSAKSYGQKFRSSLYEREIDKSIGKNGFSIVNREVRLNFLDSLITSVAVKVDYVDNDEAKQEVLVKNSEDYAILQNIKPLSDVKVTTYHVPEIGAIDSFTVELSVTIPSFTEMAVKTEVPKPYAGAFVNGFDTPVDGNMGNLWNNLWGKTYPSNSGDYTWADEAGWGDFKTVADASVAAPTWMTFDMKKYGMLGRVWLQSYWPFSNDCPKVFEIWVFTGEGEPTAEGGWNEWVKIAGFNSSDWTSDQRVAEFSKGYGADFEYGEVPDARYIRVKCLKNYKYDENMAPDQQNNGYNFGLSEITFSIYE